MFASVLSTWKHLNLWWYFALYEQQSCIVLYITDQAGVLTSSFCVVLESSYSSNAAISSLLVAWLLNCPIEASSTESVVASFKNFHTKRGGYRNWRLSSSCSLHVNYYRVHSADFIPTELTYMYMYYWVVRHHYSNSLQWVSICYTWVLLGFAWASKPHR